jgi:hypothetical protein
VEAGVDFPVAEVAEVVSAASVAEVLVVAEPVAAGNIKRRAQRDELRAKTLALSPVR